MSERRVLTVSRRQRFDADIRRVGPTPPHRLDGLRHAMREISLARQEARETLLATRYAQEAGIGRRVDTVA